MMMIDEEAVSERRESIKGRATLKKVRYPIGGSVKEDPRDCQEDEPKIHYSS